jgi:hypothetical protein
MCLDRDLLPEDEVSGCVVAVGLAFLRAVDATETDAFRVSAVQDIDGVAVEDGDDGAGEVQREYGGEGGNEEA